MFIQIALLAAQMILGEVTRQRPKRTSFKDFVDNNEPSEVRPIPYVGGTIELTPTRQWYGDYLQRAVERDSHWTDYLFLGALSFLLDTITVGYRSYTGEMFPLCYGPDTHVERITIDDRPVFQATVGTDNAGGGFLIDDPQAWGGDQPPGGGGEYAWCDLTRGNYSDHANAYLESLLSDPPNKTPSLRGVSALVKRGPSGFTESGYFFAGGIGAIPKLKLWKITVRRQPDNLATGFNKIGRHMNPMEVIYEWSTSLDYGARVPLEELNLDSWRSVAEDLYTEGTGWSGRIESATSPQAVIDDVLAQIDGILDPSPSLGLTARLIRRDYSFGSLRVLNRDNITRVERFTPGTYEDTKNVVRVEFPDQDNNFKPRPAQYIDPANQQIQSRLVPETKSFLGVADAEQANVIATRDGRAISLPRAPLECFVFPSFGRLTYRGEVVLFEWSSPSFSIVMRVLAITPNGPSETDYRLVLIEDQFATGLRTFGEPVGTAHDDPGAGLDTAPPSATWNTTDFPPNGLTLSLLLDNTNQFIPVIEGGIIFGSYAPGGQYARLYITEPGGVQTLSPVRLVPDANNEATFKWPANAEGNYEFCFQTYSLRGVTNGVKVCADIDIGAIGSPSLSPSASVSPSPSPSISPSASESPSVSPSVSPSASESLSVSPSSSESLSPSPSSSLSPSASISPSASVSPSSSISPSASQSPSSSASPSGALDPGNIIHMDSADMISSGSTPAGSWWSSFSGSSPSSTTGVSGADGRYWQTSNGGDGIFDFPSPTSSHVALRIRFRLTSDTFQGIARVQEGANDNHFTLLYQAGGNFSAQVGATTVATSTGGHISLNHWYVLEGHNLIDDSAGQIEVKLYDGEGAGEWDLLETISFSGDTRDAGTSGVCVQLVANAGIIGGDAQWDNIIVDANGEVYGPARIEVLAPNGAGNYAQLTRGGTDSGANFSQVNEVPMQIGGAGDDYVDSTGSNQRDSYALANRSITGTPRCVGLHACCQRISGTPTFKLFLRIAGVDYDSSTTFTSNANNDVYSFYWQNNPATGVAWTDSDINSTEIGILAIDTSLRVRGLLAQVLVQL